MIRYQNPLAKKGLFIRSSRGDATISVILAIILISGVFLTGGILPHMEDETLKKDTTAVVQGIKSEDESGNSFIASNTTGSDTKRSIQMKQLVLITATPTPSVTPTPSPTPTPTPTPTPISGTSGSSATASITFTLDACELIKGKKTIQGKIVATGTTQGYLLLEKEGAITGFYTELGKVLFGTPSRTYNLFLTEDDGVIDKKLRAKLFYTAGKVGEVSGGTEAVIKESTTLTCN